MNTSELISRCRLALGTLVRIQINNHALIEPIYQRIGHIESIFNFHDPESELSRLNRTDEAHASSDFLQLLSLALELRQLTDGAFSPFVQEQTGEKKFLELPLSIEGAKIKKSDVVQLDLGGIAKGYAVDKAVEIAQQLDSAAEGFIEAGGDIRYFGKERETVVTLRLGEPPEVMTRELSLKTGNVSVATSAPGVAAKYGPSKTLFARPPWPAGKSVAVVAEKCSVADAFTKAIIFGDLDLRKKMSGLAEILIFDRHGRLVEKGAT